MGIRKAFLPNDVETIRALLEHIELSIHPDTSDIEYRDDQWFVYGTGNEIIGAVAARKTTGEIRHLVVLPEHRRKGIGTQLVKQAVDFLRGQECLRIWVQIRVDNKGSQNLFKKLCFKRRPKPFSSRKNPDIKLYLYFLAT